MFGSLPDSRYLQLHDLSIKVYLYFNSDFDVIVTDTVTL